MGAGAGSPAGGVNNNNINSGMINAIIMDPQVGDIGYIISMDRDSSSVIRSLQRLVSANADIPVLLKDVDAAALERGIAAIRRHYAGSVASGRMTPERRDRSLALITPVTAFDVFGDVAVFVDPRWSAPVFCTRGYESVG